MQKISLLVMMVGLVALPGFAATETFKDVPVVDLNCSKKVAEAPDAHTRECAVKCEASGYGILTDDKKFLKFDAAGNKEFAATLKSSAKKDHLRVDVSGEVQGDTLKVSSIKLL